MLHLSSSLKLEDGALISVENLWGRLHIPRLLQAESFGISMENKAKQRALQSSISPKLSVHMVLQRRGMISCQPSLLLLPDRVIQISTQVAHDLKSGMNVRKKSRGAC